MATMSLLGNAVQRRRVLTATTLNDQCHWLITWLLKKKILVVELEAENSKETPLNVTIISQFHIHKVSWQIPNIFPHIPLF